MDHGLNVASLAVLAICIVVWGLFSARLERWNVTAPIAFVVMGILVTHEPLDVVHVSLESSTLLSTAEITLAVVLFSDAARINVRELRHNLGLPVRLLAIGLPLTIGAGFAAAVGLFAGVNLWVAALIAAIVAPTDAALGAPIMQDERVPVGVRRVLNVESGLNDGIVTPFVNLFLAGALAEEASGSTSLSGAGRDLLVGATIGVGVGIVGALALRFVRSKDWSAPAFQPLLVLGLALFAYAIAVHTGNNGFVAAFLAGMAYGGATRPEDSLTLEFADGIGELLSLLVWFAFGAAMVVPGFEHAGWQDLLFAVLAVTLIRMVPVALATIGSGLDRVTVGFVGWFGPRGLASVVFTLIAVDSLVPDQANRVLAAVTVTVVVSVVAHGVSASPLSSRYGRFSASLASDDPEHIAPGALRTRTSIGQRLDGLRLRGKPS